MALVAMLAAATAASAGTPPCASIELESYRAHLAAAEKALRLAQGPEARRWLAGAPQALRGWEWAHLDAAADQSLRTIGMPDGDLTAFAVDPGGRRAAGADTTGRLYIWKLPEWTLLRTIHGHEDAVYSIAFSPDGDRLVSASRDVTSRVWRVRDGAEIARVALHNPGVAAAAFSPDGRRIATCSWVTGDPDQPTPGVCGCVWIWNADNGDLIHRKYVGVKPLDSIQYSPDGERIAVGSWGGRVHVLDADGREVRSIELPDEGIYNAVVAVAVSPDGKLLAAGSKDRAARVWELASGKLLGTLRGHDGFVNAVCFSPDTTRLATGSVDASVRLWDWRHEKQQALLLGHERSVSDVAWTQRGVYSLSRDRTVRAWSPDEGGGAHLRASAGVDGTYTAAFTPDAAQVAVACYNGHVLLIDARTGATRADWTAHADSSCNTLAISGDGRTLVTCSWDKTAKVWNPATRELLHTFDAGAGVYSCDVSADGAVVALAAGSDVQLWDVAAARQTAVLRGHQGGVRQVSFNRAGTFAASVSDDQTLRLWDVATGETRRVINGFARALACVAFSADDRSLAVGDGGGTVVLLDVDGERRVTLFEGESAVNRVAFSPDGSRVVAAGEGVHVLDSKGAGQLLTIQPHEDTVWHVSFSPDGRRLASCSWNGAIAISESEPLSRRRLVSTAQPEQETLEAP